MNELIKFDEPRILFGYNQKLDDARDGLTLFGPWENSKPPVIVSGVVGTDEGFEKFKRFLEEIERPVYNEDGISNPFFPGFNAVFDMEWSAENIHHFLIDDSELDKCLFHEDVHTRTYNTVSLFANRIISSNGNGFRDVNLWFVIIPDIVYKVCRPQSRMREDLVVEKKSFGLKGIKKFLYAPSFFEDINKETRPFSFEADFHNQLKARLLPYCIPTQIIREGTLFPYEPANRFGIPKRDFSNIRGHLAWSISVASFYKSVGLPWKLAEVRKQVCFAGLSFTLKVTNSNQRTACSSVQIFSDNGGGLVIKGPVGPWYNPKTKRFHLKTKQAQELIQRILYTYKKNENVYPKELFIHTGTRLSEEEREGFIKGAGDKTKIVCILIKKHAPLKIYRDNSKYPNLRGLAYIDSEKSGYLWTKGFVPRIQTSSTSTVPNPLYVEIIAGEHDIEEVLKDILALTKLNYNACIHADGLPVTLKFSESVGSILTAAPMDDVHLPWSFKYYI